MEWYKKIRVFPAAKRSILSSRKNGSGGIMKLRDEVQTCDYADIQVMWEMVRQSEIDKSSSPARSPAMSSTPSKRNKSSSSSTMPSPSRSSDDLQFEEH